MLTTALRNIREFYGYRLHALDEDLGPIQEFYLSPDWKIGSMAIQAGSLGAENIYISSGVLEEVDSQKKVFFIQQAKRDIQNQLPELIRLDRKEHLKPVRKFLGCRVWAEDGEIGVVEDLIVNDADLAIRYLIVKTDLAGKRFVLSPWWIGEMDWKNRVISLGFSRQEVIQSPEYTHLSPEYEDLLHDYYGRHSYWV